MHKLGWVLRSLYAKVKFRKVNELPTRDFVACDVDLES